MSAKDDALSHAIPSTRTPRAPRRRGLRRLLLAGAALGLTPAVAIALAPAVPPEASVPLLAFAGVAGGLLAAGLEVLGSRLVLWSRPARVPPADEDPAALAAEDRGWLHLACGTDRRRAARGALELAAPALARGRRALIVEGSPRHRIHEWLGRSPRWGLTECLSAGMPVLGLVQYAGRPGLYLLAHGSPARGGDWSRLGQLLDEARPHFGRVILVTEGLGLEETGPALEERGARLWWVGGGRRSSLASRALAGRIGKALHPLELPGMPEATLEALEARLEPLQRAFQPEPAPTPEPGPEPAPVAVAAPAAPPPVLDCDLQVRERLRFLLWMRKVQSEGGRPSRSRVLEPELVSAL